MSSDRLRPLLQDVDTVQGFLRLSTETPGLRETFPATAAAQCDSLINKIGLFQPLTLGEVTQIVQKLKTGPWPEDLLAKLSMKCSLGLAGEQHSGFQCGLIP